MSKIFDVDFRKGSLIDSVSNVAGINTNGKFIQSNKGIAWSGNPLGRVIYNAGALPNKSTIVFSFNWQRYSGNHDNLFATKDNNGNNCLRLEYLSDSAFAFRVGNTTASLGLYSVLNMVVDKNYLLFIQIDYSLNTISSYLYDENGIVNTVSNHSLSIYTPNNDLSSLVIGRGYDTHRYTYSFFSFFKIHDSILTEEERTEYYKQFLHSFPLGKQKVNPIAYSENKPTDLSGEVGNVIGDERLINGDFTNGNLGWSVVMEDANNYVIFANDTMRMVSNNTSSILISQGAFTSPGTYKIIVDVASITTGRLKMNDGTASLNVGIIDKVGKTEYYFTKGTSSTFNINRYGVCDVTLNSVTIKKVSGLVAAYNMIPSPDKTLVDISGNGNNGVINGALSTLDGMKFKNSNITLPTTKLLPILRTYSKFTICGRIKPNSISQQAFFGVTNTSTNRFGIVTYNNTLTFGFYDGAIVEKFGNCPINEWNDFVAINDNKTLTLYINGIKITTVGGYNSVSTVVGIAIGSKTDGTIPFNGEIQDLRIYDYTITEQQAIEYHNSFAKQVSLLEDFSYDGVGNKPSEWIEETGAYKVDECVIGQGELVVNGDFSSGSTGWTHSSEWSFSDEKARVDALGGNVDLIQYILLGNMKYKLRYEITEYFTTTSWRIIGVKNSFGYLNLERTVGIHEIEFIPISSSFTLRVQGIGVGTIDNVSVVEIPPLPTITTGTKYLECASSGVTALQCDEAYGTWEFDFYKQNAINTLYLNFISDKIEDSVNFIGYQIVIGASNQITLRRIANGSVISNYSTAASYIKTNIWYSVKITRTNDGTFTCYIKGGDFGDDYNLISTVGGTGSNPVTDNTYKTSKYFDIDIDSGDRIANIKKIKGVEQ